MPPFARDDGSHHLFIKVEKVYTVVNAKLMIKLAGCKRSTELNMTACEMYEHDLLWMRITMVAVKKRNKKEMPCLIGLTFHETNFGLIFTLHQWGLCVCRGHLSISLLLGDLATDVCRLIGHRSLHPKQQCLVNRRRANCGVTVIRSCFAIVRQRVLSVGIGITAGDTLRQQYEPCAKLVP
eukprot:Gb_38769 [translate_table: standard]